MRAEPSDGQATTPEGRRAGRDRRQKEFSATAETAASTASLPDAETLVPPTKQAGVLRSVFLRSARLSMFLA